jgi:hypothetical protein
MSTPERELEIRSNFISQVMACGDAVVIGEETGPRPFIQRTENLS